MKFSTKYIFYFVFIIITGAFQTTSSFATTYFHIYPNNIDQRINCHYLEIKDNRIMCSGNNLTVTYNISQINNIEVVNGAKTFSVQNFTKQNIEKINNANLYKTNSINEKDTSKKTDETKQLSFDSFQDFIKSLKSKYNYLIANNTLSVIIQSLGLIVFLIGSIWYVIETFRVGILWGLSCMFLPFVSFVFLFVHWRVAAKPFMMSILGLVIAFLGTLLITSVGHTTPFPQKRINSNYKCSGKQYCSEMTSCAEAKFYLRHCRGTKIDGNNDGIPCEKQWCN
jgi:hypothetical protein